MMNQPSDYDISISIEKHDGVKYYVARASEFPDLEEYGHSAKEAWDLIIDSIETTQQIFKEKGKELPKPAGSNRYE